MVGVLQAMDSVMTFQVGSDCLSSTFHKWFRSLFVYVWMRILGLYMATPLYRPFFSEQSVPATKSRPDLFDSSSLIQVFTIKKSSEIVIRSLFRVHFIAFAVFLIDEFVFTEQLVRSTVSDFIVVFLPRGQFSWILVSL